MMPTNESYSSTNPSHKNFAVITYQLQNIGKKSHPHPGDDEPRNSNRLCNFSFQFYKFLTIISVRTISTIFELFLSVNRITSTNT